MCLNKTELVDLLLYYNYHAKNQTAPKTLDNTSKVTGITNENNKIGYGYFKCVKCGNILNTSKKAVRKWSYKFPKSTCTDCFDIKTEKYIKK